MRFKDRRVFLTFDEAVALIPPSEYVHTFENPAAGVLVGADWKRTELVELMRSCPDPECAELAGEQATSMGHGLCVHSKGQPLLYVESARIPEHDREAPAASVQP